MTELSDNELERVTKRVNRALHRFDALSFHALQYRIGEVAQKRIETHLLQRVLKEVSNDSRPRRGQVPPGPWLTPQGLYVRPNCSRDEATDIAETKIPALVEQVGLIHTGASFELATTLSSIFPSRETIKPFKARNNSFANDLDWSAPSHTTLVASTQGIRATIWFTADLDWLYPTDPRLWAFLEKCVTNQSGAVVVARKVPLMIFALCKALEMRAVQYFAVISPDEDIQRAEELRQESGWPKFASVMQLQEHPVVAHVHNAVEVTNPSSLERLAQATSVARDLGMLGVKHIEPSQLIEWWDKTLLDCPRETRAELSRLTEWTKYKISKKRKGDSKRETASDRHNPASEEDRNRTITPAGLGQGTSVERIPIRGY